MKSLRKESVENIQEDTEISNDNSIVSKRFIDKGNLHHIREGKEVKCGVAEKQFVYNFMTYLKDSNAYGNTYFAKYFEWQGISREAWFFNCIAKDFLVPLGVLITKFSCNEYKEETFPFQSVRCIVNTKNIKKASFDVLFKFCDPEDENRVFSEGYQTIVFANKDKKISKIPEDTLREIKLYSLN